MEQNGLSFRAKLNELQRAQLEVNQARECQFPLLVEVDEAEVDETIEIESMLGQQASISLVHPGNPFNSAAPFNAYFTPESPMELTMMPASGILEPEVAGGNQFIVSFTPVEYGNRGQAHHRDG